jgi:hypothetical protein
MQLGEIQRLVKIMRDASVSFAEGLTDAETASAEQRYGFRFPPDLRALLQYALPISKGFPDWRNGNEEAIRERLDWPLVSMCFDIEHNVFWLDSWGAKPADLAEAFAIARREVAKAPRLIPIMGHRYIPDEPQLAGNPIFSVYQTDIIYYGADLSDYIINEFTHRHLSPDEPNRYIRFWSDLVS